jgi:hypothetical protein
MPAVRSTVMRLERQIQLEQAQALTSLHQSYEQLAATLLQLARDRGYLGSDPLGALAHLTSPSPWEGRLGEATQELWTTFFACFRSDEAAFEAARFQEAAGKIKERVAALKPGAWPEPELTLSMLQTLSGLWEERHQAISDRLDLLIKELTEHQMQLGNADLRSAHQSDEIGRAVTAVSAALAELGEKTEQNAQPAQLLGALIGRYRRDFMALKQQVQDANMARRAFLGALQTASKDSLELPNLPSIEGELVKGMRRLVEDRMRLEEQVRQMRGHVARMQAEERGLMEEVASRDRRLARYELGASEAEDEDERLTLYRLAFAEMDAGRNAKDLLEQVRKLERIITLSQKEEQQALRIVDRQANEVVKCLHDLRKIAPLTEDPKRLRPRLLLGSRYAFKTLPGQTQALRDAARDVLEFIARLRWAAGVKILAKDAPKLQRVFREMIGLIATWRENMGDPPPASISIQLESGNSIIALPAILATDLETVLRRRGKPAAQAATVIVPIMNECVELYHATLTKAKGEDIARAQGEKRETSQQALLRLAGELTSLGGMLEALFGEAAAADWTIGEADEALISDDRLMLLSLQQLDVACDVLAVLAGAPKTAFSPLPAGRGSDKLLACAKERVHWLEEVARYRFEVKVDEYK